jgi:tetratricopeptide (TPR) repeat protein
MRPLILTIFIFLQTVSCSNIYAQKQGQDLIDSLRNELPGRKEDSGKAKLLVFLSYAYAAIDPRESEKCAMQSLIIAKNIRWKAGIAAAESTLANFYFSKTEYPRALVHWQAALKIFEEDGNKRDMANIFGLIGIVYQGESNFPKALENFYKALNLCEAIGDSQGAANNTGNIGSVYFVQGDNARAIEYFSKALKKNEEIGNKNSVGSSIVNIGNVYAAQRIFDKALECYFKALKINEETGNKDAIASISGNIGGVFFGQRVYSKALEYYLKALVAGEETGDKYTLAANLCAIGEVYIAVVKDTTGTLLQNDHALGTLMREGKAKLLVRAIDSLQKALSIYKDIHALDGMLLCYGNLSQSYKLSGDYKRALESVENYRLIKDSVFSKENNDKIVKMGMDIDYERKTAETQKAAALKLQR